MSKYKFGDTFIKENKAFIVLDCKDKTYYLQTRGGTLVTRSVDELNDLIQRLEYTFYPGLCDPKFITANDFHVGDMIIGRGRGKECWYNKKKRVGIVIGKNVRRASWVCMKKRYFIKIMWSDNSEIENINFSYVDSYFNKHYSDKYFNYHRWKLVPIVK